MTSHSPTRQQLSAAIEELPPELLPELASFVDYLRYKNQQRETKNGSSFLLSIAGLGSSEETDISERDEEVLAEEIDPIRGWTLNRSERDRNS